MTHKKLRLVRARLFAACPVRRGTRYLDEDCSVNSPLDNAGLAARPVAIQNLRWRPSDPRLRHSVRPARCAPTARART